MPSIETITTSDIVIPSRASLRDHRPVADIKLLRRGPPEVAVAPAVAKAEPPEPVASYRVTDAVSIASLFGETAPVEQTTTTIEDDIAEILALLESDSADAAPSEARAAQPTADNAVATAAVETPKDRDTPATQPTSPTVEQTAPAVSSTARSEAPELEPHVAEVETVPEPTSVDTATRSQAPASTTEVAARLADLISDHKSLLEEFAAATDHLVPAASESASVQPPLVANENHPGPPAEAESNRPAPASEGDATREDVDVSRPVSPPPSLPAWSSAAGASAAPLRDPAVENLVRAIAAAQSFVPSPPPPAPPPTSVHSMKTVGHTDDIRVEPDLPAYVPPSEIETPQLNPVPGFLGGVAMSGIVGAALWAVLHG